MGREVRCGVSQGGWEKDARDVEEDAGRKGGGHDAGKRGREGMCGNEPQCNMQHYVFLNVFGLAVLVG